MKLDFDVPTDGKLHRYCIVCHAEGATKERIGGRAKYHCEACGRTEDRALYFNEHKAWLDENRELWHESCGVLVQNRAGQYLFFKRTGYPYALTAPAGHVDTGESADVAAIRELEEETGIKAPKLILVGSDDVWVDSCSSGADVHRWCLYFFQFEDDQAVSISEEGEQPLWLTLTEAKEAGLVSGFGYMLRKFEAKLPA